MATAANYQCALCKYAALTIKRQKYHIDCGDIPNLYELFNSSYLLSDTECDEIECLKFPNVDDIDIPDLDDDFSCVISITITSDVESCNPMFISII